MFLPLPVLYRVREVRPRLRHRQCAHDLADDNEGEAQNDLAADSDERGGCAGEVAVWQKEAGENTLSQRRGVRNVVRRPILREQERGDRCERRVVPGRHPVFEEVEGCQGEEEERDAPERVGGVEEREECG